MVSFPCDFQNKGPVIPCSQEQGQLDKYGCQKWKIGCQNAKLLGPSKENPEDRFKVSQNTYLFINWNTFVWIHSYQN